MIYKQFFLNSFLLFIFLLLSINIFGQNSVALQKIIDRLQLRNPSSYSRGVNFENGVRVYGEGEYKSAVRYFNKAIIGDPFDFMAYFNRGLCYYKMQDKDHACM